jgi:ABC-type branched-subunit amino acid transport system substrate-binding protein
MRPAVVVALLLLSGCSRKAEPDVQWVGHVAPLTGPRRERGEEAARAIELLLERSKADGKKVAVRHVDAENKATVRAEATRLLAVNRVLALLVGPGIEDIDDVTAAARAHDAGVIVLEQDPHWQGRALATFVFEKLKVRSVKIDRRLQPRVADGFASAWREAGGAVSDREGEVGGVLTDGMFHVGETSYEAVLYPEGHTGSDAAKGWRASYEKRFRQPPTADALLAHDGLGILLAELAETEGGSRQKLQESLARRKAYEGLTGTLRQVDGRWRWPLFIARHKAGKREILEAVPVPE